jgi:hypothetical protein
MMASKVNSMSTFQELYVKRRNGNPLRIQLTQGILQTPEVILFD